MKATMPRWSELQAAFATALRNPETLPPESIGKTAGAPSSKRFGVYRNNVAVSLIDALAANFPVVAALIGGDAFAGLAREYMSGHLPKTPVLMDYGDEFPGFIAAFKPLAELPFLHDVARLECAWNAAYNAADVDLAGIEALSAIPADALGDVRFAFPPALHVVRSPFPVASIWFAHQGCDTDAALKALPKGGEDALVTRPVADVEIRCLPVGAAIFIEQLMAGHPLGAAAETAANACDAFDASTAIGGLFESGAVCGLKP